MGANVAAGDSTGIRSARMRPRIRAGRTFVVSLRGEVAGVGLRPLATALDQVVRGQPATVLVDLLQLSGWSATAQAMLSLAARRIRRSGGEMILLDPSDVIRARSAPLEAWARVTSGVAKPRSWPEVDPARAVSVGILAEDGESITSLRRVEPE